MPHIILEYSANLEIKTDIPALVRCVHKAALETGVFAQGGVRTRAARRDIYEIADGHDDNAFVHVHVRIGAGRAEAEKRAAGQYIFDALTGALAGSFACTPLAVSLEMSEINPGFSFKRNNLHEYIRERTGAGAGAGAS